MQLLFISGKDVLKKSNGGELCTNRNYESFCELIGEENVTVINLLGEVKSGLKNALAKRFNYLFGFYEGLNQKKIRDIINASSRYNLIFIDSSIHGTLAMYLKKSEFKGKIVTFFHNVEFLIKLQKARKSPWKLAEIFVTYKSEKLACKYSDHLVAVNSRDLETMKRYYTVGDFSIIPISLKDRFSVSPDGITSLPPTLLFTGNNWYANIHGLNWFIENVLDSVDIKLRITGHKMDALKDKYFHPKIEFLGFVDDLPAVINEADFILSPIFIGSGMKVKTCEALMFGKNIIATKESFEGYDVDPQIVGAQCETKEEFIEAIRWLSIQKLNKYNSRSRDYFLNKYSFIATLDSFKVLL